MQIIKGSEEQVKAQILEKRAEFKGKLKQVKAEIKNGNAWRKQAIKEGNKKLERELDKKLGSLDGTLVALANRLAPFEQPVTRFIPVQIQGDLKPSEGGYIFNYKMVQAIYKRCKGFDVTEEFKGGELIIRYRKGKQHGRYKLRPVGAYWEYRGVDVLIGELEKEGVRV